MLSKILGLTIALIANEIASADYSSDLREYEARKQAEIAARIQREQLQEMKRSNAERERFQRRHIELNQHQLNEQRKFYKR